MKKILLSLRMPEPLRTETVRAKIIDAEIQSDPFSPTDPNRVHASLGKFEDPYSAVRNDFLKTVADHVKPINPKFEKISAIHGRNMTEKATSNKVVWTGPYSGDIFGARNTKGTVFPNISLERWGNEWWEVRPYGLLDDANIPAVKKVSEVLRKNGLPTEKITAVKELEEIMVLNKNTNEWESIDIKKWEEQELERIKKDEPMFYENVKRYLRETKFVAVERDMQVDIRLQDLAIYAKNNKLKEVLGPVLKWLNVATQAKGGGIIANTPKPERFEYTKEGVEKYFKEYLPSQMGIYLGRFHKLGLVHRYLHSQNWSAVGTILDLDSVYGLIIFPDYEEPEEYRLEGDVRDTLYDLNEVLIELTGTDELKDIDPQELEIGVNYNFLYNYLTERFGNITKEGIKNIEAMDFPLESTTKAIEMLKANLTT